jgi:AraC family transcriptional regulator
MSALTPTFHDRPLFRLAGLSRTHTFAEASKTIPPQWDEFSQLPIPGREQATTFYGASYDFNQASQTLSYLSGFEVPDFNDLPKGVTRLIIPAAHYAVFTHTEGIATIIKTWRFIMDEWLPSTGNKHSPTPDFELYDERFTKAPATGPVEIWIPIPR